MRKKSPPRASYPSLALPNISRKAPKEWPNRWNRLESAHISGARPWAWKSGVRLWAWKPDRAWRTFAISLFGFFRHGSGVFEDTGHDRPEFYLVPTSFKDKTP